MTHACRLVILLLSPAQIICAQGAAIDWHNDLFGEKAKDHSCWFLTLPVSARAMGTGTIASQGAMDATDLPFFPANTGRAERNSFAVTHYNWLMGMNKEYTGAVFPTIRFGTLGLFSELFTTGSGREPYTADGISSRLSLLEYAVGGTFGRSFFDERLSIGVAATYIGSYLDRARSSTESFSADLLYAPGERLSMRAYARNIGSQPSLPLQTGAVVSAAALQSQDLVNGPRNIITLETGIRKTAGNPLQTAISAVWDPFPALSLRSGYNIPSGSTQDETGLYAGIGLRIRDFSLDAAWKNQTEKPELVWAASAAMNLGDFIKRSSDDYVRLANSNYIHRRYGNSLEYSKKALRQDPGNWMAHNLFRKAVSALEREKASELWILYSGNFKGKFIASDEDGSMGGLARTATILKKIRRAVPFSISIATGNMVTHDSPPALEKVTRDYFTYLVDDDARCIGQGELDYGVDRILSDPTCKPMLSLIPPDSRNPKIVSSIIINRQEHRFAVISAVRNPGIDTLLKQKNSSFPEEILKALGDSATRGCNLRILVLHDTWEHIERYGETLRGADVIICADLEDGFIPARKLGESIVVAVPNDGTAVGNLIVRLDSQKRTSAYENLWIPLSEDIAPDKKVADWIATLMPNASVKRALPSMKRFSNDFFAISKEVDGVNKVYVKTSGSLKEIPLNMNDTALGLPAFSSSAGKVAFMHTDKKHGCSPLAVFSVAEGISKTIVGNKNVREAIFSPNSKWIYCTASDCDDTITDIFRVRTNGGVLYPVVTWHNSTETGVVFSPKSQEIAFCSNRDGSWQVYLTNLDGTRPLRLTDDEDNHLKPLFSPDGKYIAYLSNHLNTDGSMDLWMYDRANANHVRITKKMRIYDYCWLDSQRKILVSAGLDYPELQAVDIRTGIVSKFLSVPPDSAEAPFGEENPRFMVFNGKKKVLYYRDFGDGERNLHWTAVDGTDDKTIFDKE